VAERNQGEQQKKKFKSYNPRGSKLAAGYVDRAQTRQDEDEDDRAARLKALEEAYKNEEIDQATYEKQRFQIAGGDLSSTHLVKGLDFKLLERVRKGEDVYIEKKAPPEEAPREHASEESDHEQADVEDELDRLEKSEVHAVEKERVRKKGQLAMTSLVPGKKRTRDQILAEMKAAREAAKAKAESALGGRFKKIGGTQVAGSRIERDSRGREVLIIVDEDGHEKRKVRKLAGDDTKGAESFRPDQNAEVLGMEVPEFYRKKQEQEAERAAAKEVNIFDDAGSDYDPLAGMDSDSDDSESESETEHKDSAKDQSKARSPAREESKTMPPPPPPVAAPPVARNYFKDAKSGLISEEASENTASTDPGLLAALKKAKALKAAEKTEEEDQEAERQERLKKLLQRSERDAEDMDLGFGMSRGRDEDAEEGGAKVSTWGDEEGEEGRGGKSKRKRGPKKKKGDGNNADDVMRVLERRQGAGS